MKKFRILTVDGGGIRGVIPAVWLAQIAQRLSKPLHKHFDLVVGTSTGSIVAGALAMEKDMEHCIDLYESFGRNIFPRSLYEKNAWSLLNRYLGPIYSGEPLESALKQLFAIDTSLSACSTDMAVVSYDVFNRCMCLLRSYDKQCKDIPIWEACKASSSAPTYFPAHLLQRTNSVVPLIDGGVIANNPSMLAISEAINISGCDSLREFHRQNEIVMISLGTGSLMRKITPAEAQSWGAMQWARPVIDVLFDGTSELSHVCAAQIVSTKNYVRLQVNLYGVNDDMDDASNENINSLKALATNHIESDEGKEKLEKIIRLLTD